MPFKKWCDLRNNNLTREERSADCLVAKVCRKVEALGGELEVVAEPGNHGVTLRED
jgi:hypothetical protein